MQISIFRFRCEELKRRICEILDIITEQKVSAGSFKAGNSYKLGLRIKSQLLNFM